MERTPILEILTVVLMLAFAGLGAWRGAFRASVLFFSQLAAGFLAFDCFEPFARGLERVSGDNDHVDGLSILVPFVVLLVALLVVARRLAPSDLSFAPWIKRLGGAGFGLASGYFLAAILICVLQTLPVHQRFLGYDPAKGIGLGAPDRIWLAMMHRASGQVFDRISETWFDADGSFIPRYARYRRTAEGASHPEVNQGEFPEMLSTGKPRADL